MSKIIMLEVQRLYGVSDNLDSLADQFPVATAALLSISGNIRSNAALLEVVVNTKISPLSGLQ